MKNLMRETLQELKDNNIHPGEVLWCGTPNYHMSWVEFARLADKEYDDDFGSEEVNALLLVVGKDWWLERHEYDGSEWWEYKTLPTKPKKHYIPSTLFTGYDGDNNLIDSI